MIHNYFTRDGKLTHGEVDYGQTTGRDYCAICTHYRKDDNVCTLVQDVEPDGWCKLFKRAADA